MAINKKKVLAVILARGGSKGIKLKNITNLSGHPLISYTLEAAKNSATYLRIGSSIFGNRS